MGEIRVPGTLFLAFGRITVPVDLVYRYRYANLRWVRIIADVDDNSFFALRSFARSFGIGSSRHRLKSDSLFELISPARKVRKVSNSEL